MSLQLYVDPFLNQLVRSPSYASIPVLSNFVRDDLLPVTVFFCNTSQAIYIQNPVTTLRLAIGSQNQFPTGGTFTLTFGGSTTSALAYNISPAALQTALQGLTSIGAGNCAVVGFVGQLYAVTFTGSLAGASQSLITTSAQSLVPNSEVYVSHDVVGGSGVNDVQCINLKAIAPVVVTNFTALSGPNYGYSASVNLSRYEIAQLLLAQETAGLLLEIDATDLQGNRPTYVQQAITVSDDIIGGASVTGGTYVTPYGNFSISGSATNYVIPLSGMTATGQLSIALLPSTGAPADPILYQDYSTPGQVTVSVGSAPGSGSSYNIRYTVLRFQ